MVEILNSPITWIVFAALSEIIGLSPLKDNSIAQLALRAIKKAKPAHLRRKNRQ